MMTTGAIHLPCQSCREKDLRIARLETENERLAYLLKETLDRLEKLRQQNENNL